MKLRRGLHCGLFVFSLALGCSSTVTGDAGLDAAVADAVDVTDAPPADSAPPDPETGPALDELPARLIDARCAQLARCGGDEGPLPELVLEACRRGGWQEVHIDRRFTLAHEAAREGAVRYDAEAARRCLALLASSCTPDTFYSPACRYDTLFVGEVPLGGACVGSQDCAGDAWCAGVHSWGGCTGVCTARSPRGAPCTLADGDESCTTAGVSGRVACVRGACSEAITENVAEGELCFATAGFTPGDPQRHRVCPMGTVCFGPTPLEQRCQAPRVVGEGERCASTATHLNVVCRAPLLCVHRDEDWIEGEAFGVCRADAAPLRPGDPCSSSRPFVACPPYTRCFPANDEVGNSDERCRYVASSRTEGAPCGAGPEISVGCVGDLVCVDGACQRATRRHEGEACRGPNSTAPCEAGLYCAGPAPACRRQLPAGSACEGPDECYGGACVDGRCASRWCAR